MFHIAFINYYKPFLKSFFKAFIIKPFQILSPVLIYIFRENRYQATSLTSKKCRLAKFCKVDAWSQALLFTGETSFSSRFSLTFPRFPRKLKNRLNTSLKSNRH